MDIKQVDNRFKVLWEKSESTPVHSDYKPSFATLSSDTVSDDRPSGTLEQSNLTSNIPQNENSSKTPKFSKTSNKGTNTTWKEQKGFEGVDEKTFDTLGKIGKPPGQGFVDKMNLKTSVERYIAS